MRKPDGLNRFVLAASFAVATVCVAGGAAHGATICHYPPGNPSNVQIIIVGDAALPAHLAHGDKLQDCAGVCGGTKVRDCAGVCGGTAVPDCAGVCDGSGVKDCAGVCDGSAVKDCAGACDGSAVKDCAGVCNGPATKDCLGNCGTQEQCGQEECCAAGATCCHNCNEVGICGVPEFACANTNTDPNNCGECFHVCTTGACENGSCVQLP